MPDPQRDAAGIPDIGKVALPTVAFVRSQTSLTVIENVRSAVAPTESVTWTTKVNVPLVVGVPVIRPGLGERLSPGGSVPCTRDQV